jgi:hypothetical protein
MRQVCAVRMIAELEEINTHRTRSTRGHFAANRSVMGQAPGVSLRGMSASRGYRSLMGQGESSFGADAFGRLRSRSALDGVSWVQGGSVEIGVGQRLAPCNGIRAVVCSLPRASLLLGAGFGLLSRGFLGLSHHEFGPVSQHRVHDDREAAGQSDSGLAHR